MEAMPDEASFGDVLRHYRTLAGLTQEMLANSSGVALRTISDLERGRVSRPQRHTIGLIATALGLQEQERSSFIATARAAVARQRGAVWDGGERVPGQGGPRPVASFVGRAGELASMDAKLTGDDPATLVISGSPGVGKTALAMQWSSRSAASFPGGCLELNLHGYSARAPVGVAEALARLLPAAGVSPDQIPADADDAIRLWHEVTAARRILLVLDDARDAGQVRPLILTGTGCATVVTCRRRLPGLVVSHAARTLNLGVLARADSMTLITTLADLPGSAPAGEQAGLDDLAAACADLPLALRIAAAHLMTQPSLTARALAGQIGNGHGLAALTISDGDAIAVAGAFALSHRVLSPAAQRVFAMFGLEPVRDLSLETATALTGQPAAWTRQALADLVSANLVDESAAGRFSCHDLLRAFAAEQAGLDGAEGRSWQAEAIGRLRALLIVRSRAAARLLYPQMTRLPDAEAGAGGGGAQEFTDRAAAAAWLGAETATIVALIGHASQDQADPAASWLLADALRGWFYHQRLLTQWIAATRAALSAAQRRQAIAAQAALRISLGMAAQARGRYTEAIAELERAAATAGQAGWLECYAAAIGNLGTAHYQLGRTEQAAELYQQALDLNRQLGNFGGQAIRLGNLGGIHRAQGRELQAAQCYQQAAELYRAVGSVDGEALMTVNLGSLAVNRGAGDEALRLGTVALALATTANSRPFGCIARRVLAEAHLLLGDVARAASLATTALEQSRQADDPRLIVDCLNTLAKTLQRSGEHDLACDRASEAVRVAGDIGYQDGARYASEMLAALQEH